MNIQYINDRILSGNQQIVIYLHAHQIATVDELRKITRLKNVSDSIAKLNRDYLPKRGLPLIRRSRDDKGRAVYSWGVQ